MSVLILGDPHIGAGVNIGKTGVGSNLNSRIVDQINLLDYVFDLAFEEYVDNIIITGDIFEDPNPHSTLITLFISWLKKCEISNINVHIILGNHDILRSGNIYTSSLDIISEADISNTIIYKNIDTIFIEKTAFTLVPFRDRKSFNCKTNKEALELLKNIIDYECVSISSLYKKVLVGHLAIEGSIPCGDEIGDIGNELYCPLSLFNNYNKVWMGHVHKPQVLKEEPYISHIGSMDISNFGEVSQEKYVVIVDCENNKNKDFNIKYLPTRSLKKVNITIPKDIKDTTKYVMDEISGMDFSSSIVKVEITLSDQSLALIDKKVVEDYLVSKGAFNVANILQSKNIKLVKKEGNLLSNKMDIKSSISMYANLYIDEDKRERFIEVANEIYDEYKCDLK
jgi:exonuclease SbcD